MSDQIDLCLAAPRFYPAYSGPGLRFHRYEPGLRVRGITMRVLAEEPSTPATRAAGTNESGRGSTLLPRVDSVDGIPVYRVAVPDGGIRAQWAYARALANFCGDSERRPDLVQLLGVSLAAAPWIARLRQARIPLVFTHTMGAQMSPRPWKRRLQRIYWPIPFQLMDCIVVSSTVMLDGLKEIGVTRRIEVIPNGVDLNRFHPVASLQDKRALRERLRLPIDGELIVFVGPLVERKGVDILVDAFARVAHSRPSAHLVLVGPRHSELGFSFAGSDAFEAKLDEIVRRENLADRVLFTGGADRVEDYLRAGDLFVFPSRREGMPNVVPEAFACGVPSILTPFVGLPAEFGRPGEQYVLADRTADGVAGAMRGLLVDSARRRALGHACLQWARERLDVNRSLDSYAELYRELVRPQRTSRSNAN